MRRLSIIIISLILMFSSSVVLGASQGKLNVSPSTVSSNGMVTATGGGFKPLVDVEVMFDGGSVKVIKADIRGNISFNYDVPANTSKGVHSLSAQGASSGTQPGDVEETYSKGSRVLVGSVKIVDNLAVLGEQTKPEQSNAPIASSGGQLPYTGGTPLWALLIAGLILAATGFGIKVVKRN